MKSRRYNISFASRLQSFYRNNRLYAGTEKYALRLAVGAHFITIYRSTNIIYIITVRDTYFIFVFIFDALILRFLLAQQYSRRIVLLSWRYLFFILRFPSYLKKKYCSPYRLFHIGFSLLEIIFQIHSGVHAVPTEFLRARPYIAVIT